MFWNKDTYTINTIELAIKFNYPLIDGGLTYTFCTSGFYEIIYRVRVDLYAYSSQKHTQLWQALSYDPQGYKIERLCQWKELILSFLRVCKSWVFENHKTPLGASESRSSPKSDDGVERR